MHLTWKNELQRQEKALGMVPGPEGCGQSGQPGEPGLHSGLILRRSYDMSIVVISVGVVMNAGS